MSDIPTWVKMGAKCICVDPQVNAEMTDDMTRMDSDPTLNGIYTINWFGDDGFEDKPCLGFIECDQDACWDIDCFRPLVSKTEPEDLAVFRRIADLAGVDEALRRLEGVE